MTQTNPSRFSILLASDITPTARLLSQVAGTRAIAADGGMAHAQTLGLTPELWVGDFDSTEPQLEADYTSVPRQVFNPAKDTTDGELAVNAALERGANSLVFVGAFGRRTDHTFALMAQACALAAKGVDVILTSGAEEGTPLSPQPQKFDYATGTLFSVLAFSALNGLTLTGAHWPLDAITMEFGDTLTLSNLVEGQLSASLVGGTALLLAQVKA